MRAGKDRRLRSSEEGVGRPVRDGIRSVLMVSSRGSNRASMSGIVLIMKFHSAIIPCLNAEKAAWGSLFAISASCFTCFVHSSILLITNVSVNTLSPKAAL